MTDKGILSSEVFKSLIEEELQNQPVNREIVAFDAHAHKNSFSEKILDFSLGAGYEYFSEDIYFRHVKLEKGVPSSVTINLPMDYIQVIFCLMGGFCYRCGEVEKTALDIREGLYNVIHFAQKELSVQSFSAEGFEGLVLYLKKGYLETFQPFDSPLWTLFLESVHKNESAVLSNKHLHLDNKIKFLLRQLLEEKLSGSLKFFFVEAKVREFLIYHWNQLAHHDQGHSHDTLDSDQVEKMEAAKEILLNSLKDGITLKELSHQVGTNEYHLKRNFKLVYGRTVFGFLLDYKMEMANYLLQDPTLKISDIADKLGYNHATHFSAAYKKHFGLLPKEAKAGGKSPGH
ncbi:hypothetical protein P872_22985 [Rhodonellum psychrophilum GCM71 = DSM 17998]|uniref:HTH araC/xylS-type domain-containing protein n=2 Tax=Rhodonellum TaxID=336827 RepID=U5BWB2_9BACT|nr:MULTISPECIES: AraC family transcriptional regulator [Rhodonellum]ERM84930.1 hypothetical protein P872_22985 [Rhodonellum psychrophilum GCM71 = DSM 17998]SDY73946.1 AraC-type DNA-binding protein [Rhodonellum ikkaensis]